MVIQHNISAINSYRNLGINQSAMSKNLEKLSSGYKINRAGDDAAGLAISESMRSQINGLNQASKNADDAVGLIQTAEGALTETHSMLQRLTTLATQSANGTYNSTARNNIQKEVNALVAEIDRIAKSTDFNGIKPLASASVSTMKDVKGAATTMQFQIGATSSETISIKVVNMTAASLGISTMNTSGVNGGQSTMFLGMNAGDTNLKAQKRAQKAMDTLKAAINTVSSYRADLGAAQNRLEHTISNLDVTSENITAAESRIRDTDMADEITAFTKNNILLQAAQSMLSQSNSMPQGVLSLLQ